MDSRSCCVRSSVRAGNQGHSDVTDPVELVLMYVEEPGSQIRSWGPESDQADFAVMKVDQLIALLMEQLSVAGLEDSVNLLVTGVHGFCEVSTDKVFDISGSIGDTSYIHGHSPVLNIKPPKDEELDTYANLQTSSDKDKFDLYTRRLVPQEYHYSGSSRVSEIVLVAKEGFAFAFDFTISEIQQEELLHNRVS